MKKKWTMVTVAALSFLAACNGVDDENEATQTDENDETVETAGVTDGNGGFLWKIEHEDTDVYLQGTIHVGREDFYPLNEQTEAAYEEADVVLPEVDLVDVDQNEVETMMTGLSLLEEGQTLDELISDEAFEKLEAIFAEYGMPVELVQGFEPWFVENMLLTFSIADSDVDEGAGVDDYFLRRAVDDGKEIRELESIESQFNVLSGFSMETQVQLLEHRLQNMDEAGEELETMADNWVKGDIEGLIETWEDLEDSNIDDEYAYELNEVRNYDMANTISDILQENSGQTYFVIVGSLHLVAEPSIVSILEDEGYTVEFVY
ncbi:TraB/GumN family protein [Shouchella lehensis]|uniref:TraB/GumN family protein n=1 Tax=Shouchella lehensis G1 TaxID=1246626 RepID=A0A060LRG9_9BACI|nr:TraB/GumN family protein [Shouchella lehensis]AIC92762.1 hypothetical protein BleG1_0154 [Shouchella lehensis G1]